MARGQVENQVGVVRQRFFSPRVRARSYEELNAWLMDRCVAYARAQAHPEIRDQTIWETFELERPSLVPYRGPFDGFHAVQASPSKTVDAVRRPCGSTVTKIRKRSGGSFP